MDIGGDHVAGGPLAVVLRPDHDLAVAGDAVHPDVVGDVVDADTGALSGEGAAERLERRPRGLAVRTRAVVVDVHVRVGLDLTVVLAVRPRWRSRSRPVRARLEGFLERGVLADVPHVVVDVVPTVGPAAVRVAGPEDRRRARAARGGGRLLLDDVGGVVVVVAVVVLVVEVVDEVGFVVVVVEVAVGGLLGSVVVGAGAVVAVGVDPSHVTVTTVGLADGIGQRHPVAGRGRRPARGQCKRSGRDGGGGTGHHRERARDRRERLPGGG